MKPRKIEYNPSPRPSVQVEEIVVTEPRPYCTSPTPYSKSNIGNLLQKFSSDGGELIQKNFVAKKRAPKPPTYDSNDGTPPWMKKGPAPPIPSPSSRKSDPIREMESIGKNSYEEVNFCGNSVKKKMNLIFFLITFRMQTVHHLIFKQC